MRHLVAGLLVGVTMLSPVGMSFSTSALAIDCADAANLRPGGYCALTTGGNSLSVPVDPPVPCIEETPPPAPLGMLPADFFLTPGARVQVAQVYCPEEPDPE